nr:PKD domain-containing protein [Bacteroidota bacterium]
MYRYILLIAALGLQFFSLAQCPGCVPDLTCTSSPAFPTICPTQPADATAGVPYVADLSFWMPSSFSDPGSGISVDFQQMTITGISGLPFGLSIETSDPAGVYFPQQNEYGCARICGIPINAGTYNITISILATVDLSGFITQVPEEFILVLTVLPGSGGNSSFTFSPSGGCGSVTAQFEALIDGDPSPTSYEWNFGNGDSSALQQPPPQIYDQPGEYVITLETTIGGYVLNAVSITGVNGNWCGDVEEPNVPFVGCTGSPDLYFVLTDANGGTFGSSTNDDTFSASWNDLALVLGEPPYSISFYDEDPVSQHDLLGTYNIPSGSAGTQFINVAGGTTGSLEISLADQQSFFDSDTLIVFPLPEVSITQVANE